MSNFEFVFSKPKIGADTLTSLPPEQLFEKTIGEAFDYFDRDGDGRLATIDEFGNALRALGCRPSVEALSRWWDTLSRAKVPASMDRPVPLSRQAEEELLRQRAVWRVDFLTSAPTLLEDGVVEKSKAEQSMRAFDTDADSYVSVVELESVLGVMGTPLKAEDV